VVQTKVETGGDTLNSDQLEGKWKPVKSEVRERRGKLTDDDIQIVAGRRDQLIGRVEERYGIAKEAATKEVDTFLKYLRGLGGDFTSSTDNRPKAHSVGR
jgi:uncharacterized protein YjbJ (UPF0337 family)